MVPYTLGSKILSTVVSTFTAAYVYLWSTYFPAVALSPPLPSFDGRAVIYPSTRLLRDYLSWRQVDCKEVMTMMAQHVGVVLIVNVGHINNLYNTTFWAMVQKGGISTTEAEAELKVTHLPLAAREHRLM